jgi:hypothetical protein
MEAEILVNNFVFNGKLLQLILQTQLNTSVAQLPTTQQIMCDEVRRKTQVAGR